MERDEYFALILGCTQMLSGSAPVSRRARLTQLAGFDDLDSYPDYYGRDRLIHLVEDRCAEIFGTERSVFFPTGTMAQQVALRYWARQRGSNTMAVHPFGHQGMREGNGLSTLCGFELTWPFADARVPDPRGRYVTAADVLAMQEQVAALVLELPMREAGFTLPPWDDLVALADAVRSRGAALHIDGARLWEATEHFGRPLDEIAALADSTYVSLYKSIGGMGGAVLLGDAALGEFARAWRHRSGGDVFQQWPLAISALDGIEHELPRLPEYVRHARVVAAVLGELPGARVHPPRPHTNQFQLWLPHAAAELNRAALDLARFDHLWFAPAWTETNASGYSVTEVTVAGPGLAMDAEDVRRMAAAFLARLGS